MELWNWIIILIVAMVPAGLAWALCVLRRQSAMAPPPGWRDGEATQREPGLRWLGWTRTGGHG